ncbi:hypothetical protein D3C85_1356790 [compost metagenome]
MTTQLFLLGIDGVPEGLLELIVADVGINAFIHDASHVGDKVFDLRFTGRFQAFFQGCETSLQLYLGTLAVQAEIFQQLAEPGFQSVQSGDSVVYRVLGLMKVGATDLGFAASKQMGIEQVEKSA